MLLSAGAHGCGALHQSCAVAATELRSRAARDTRAVRALMVTNMWPTQARPALGTFVVDQVRALRRRDDVDLDLHVIEPGAAGYARAIPALVRRRGYDVVHAHFGLTAVPALAAGGKVRGVTLHGSDLMVPRSRRATLSVLGRYDVVGVPSDVGREMLPPAHARRAQLLPCGIDTHGFTPLARADARRALELDPDAPFALFPYDPQRAVKRIDRARAAAGELPLRTLGAEPRERMRLWYAAASVVLCPADWETFGMAAVEALACGTPVVATPTGVHEAALAPAPWCHVSPFDEASWRAAVARAVDADAQHADGPALAERWSSDVMAGRLVDAWQAALTPGLSPQG